MAGKLERPAAIALSGIVGLGEGAALDGLFRPSEDGLESRGGVVAPPHPLYGGSMESPVVTELAYALDAAGIASLRFDWRGVGGSAGTVSGESLVADEDYGAALAFLRDSVTGPIIACGYSFGAAAAIRAVGADPKIKRLVLVAPPPALLDADLLKGFAGKVFIAVGEHDEFAPLEQIEALANSLPDATLLTIPGADHFFMRGLGDLTRALAPWLSGNAR